ncbi:MAG: hypothetical protein AAF556_02970, partial [Pseudomonadota bacterium]
LGMLTTSVAIIAGASALWDPDTLLALTAPMLVMLAIGLGIRARQAFSIDRWVVAVGCLVVGGSVSVFGLVYLGASAGVMTALTAADTEALSDVSPALAEVFLARDASVFRTGNHYTLWLLTGLVSTVWTMMTLAVLWFHTSRFKLAQPQAAQPQATQGQATQGRNT